MSNSQDQEISSLQTLLKGEYMALGVYDALIPAVDDDQVQNSLHGIQHDHTNHAQQLRDRLQALGAKPADNAGMAGFMARTGLRAKTIIHSDVRDILRQVYDGEDQGIDAAQKVAAEGLAGDSLSLAQQILDEDRSHLHQLESLIAAQTGDK